MAADHCQNQGIRHWAARSLVTPAHTLSWPQLGLPAPALLKALEIEGISVALATGAATLAAADREPLSPLLPVLEQRRKQALALELLRSTELESVIQQWHAASIDFMLLKGEALARCLYEAPQLRERADIDVVFRSDHHRQLAWQVLAKRGYSRAHTLTGHYVGLQFSSQRNLAGKITVCFDLHTSCSDYLFLARQLSYNDLASAKSVAAVGRQAAAIPGLTHLLLHACIHRLANRPQGTADRLVWLYDIHLLSQCFGRRDWTALQQACANADLAWACKDALDVTHSLFGTEIPSEVLSQLQARAVTSAFTSGDLATRAALYWHDFKQNKGIANKIRQLREHALPSAAYMRAKYPDKPGALLPLLYAQRLWQGLAKYRGR